MSAMAVGERLAPLSMQRAERDFAGFADALGASFRDTGFAIITDHGLDEAAIADALAATKAFFALPEADKRRYHVPGGGGQRGYTPFGVEAAKGAAASDLKEFWHVGRRLPHGHPLETYMPANIAVDHPADFDAATYNLFEAMDRLGLQLLRAIAAHLGLAFDYFDAACRDGNSILRLLHYPAQQTPPPPGSVRAGAHEDINVITLLLGAEEAGLQVRTKDGDWLDINPEKGAAVVNIGDMLQRLCNHALPSTTHRVVNPAADRAGFARYSMPFFLHFRPDFVIKTLPTCLGPGAPDLYSTPITAQEFLDERLREIRLK